MREKMLKKLAEWHTAHPWRALLIVLLLTFIFIGFASQLTITTRTSDLLPERDPKVIQFNKIIDEFATATNLIVYVEGEEQRIKEFADQLAPLILELSLPGAKKILLINVRLMLPTLLFNILVCPISFCKQLNLLRCLKKA